MFTHPPYVIDDIHSTDNDLIPYERLILRNKN